MQTAKGIRHVGGETKMQRMGQRYDADGRGSEVVAVARSESGLDLGALVRSLGASAARHRPGFDDVAEGQVGRRAGLSVRLW